MHTHARIHTRTRTYAHTHACMHACTHVRARTHTPHTHIHTLTNTRAPQVSQEDIDEFQRQKAEAEVKLAASKRGAFAGGGKVAVAQPAQGVSAAQSCVMIVSDTYNIRRILRRSAPSGAEAREQCWG